VVDDWENTWESYMLGFMEGVDIVVNRGTERRKVYTQDELLRQTALLRYILNNVGEYGPEILWNIILDSLDFESTAGECPAK
jgi:hypothetical protein